MIITGKEKGKTGKVLRLEPQRNRVWVEKLNIVKRHQRPNQQMTQGGIVEKEAPLDISNVMFYDEKLNKPTRLGVKFEDGKKYRYSKKTGETVVANK